MKLLKLNCTEILNLSDQHISCDMFPKWIFVWFVSLWAVMGFAQNTYVNSNPFPDRFFIENKGQFDHIDSNIAAVMWTGTHNIYLERACLFDIM